MTDSIFLGYTKDETVFWLNNAGLYCEVSLDKTKAWDFKNPDEALRYAVQYLRPDLLWFVEMNGEIKYSSEYVANEMAVEKAKELISHCDETDLVKNFGTITVTSAGDGLYRTKRYGIETKSFPITILAIVDPTTIERDPDGSISYAYCQFYGVYSPFYWNYVSIGDMYTDSGIEDSINKHLASLGFSGKVYWSEHGRQEKLVADFDMDFELIDELWPDLKDT